MNGSAYSRAVTLAAACGVVGLLAARGVFNSIFNFPWIFALVCLILGLISLWRDRPRRALAARAAIILAGAAVAVGGSLWQARQIDQRVSEEQARLRTELAGMSVPALEGLEPLNVDAAVWHEAAVFDRPATIVAFWARWCSPCWAEMAELEELYREHRDRGLVVLAVTRYDDPDDPDERRRDFDRARRFLDRRDFSYPAAITDDLEIYRGYRVPGPPRTVLVDERGRIADYAIDLDGVRELMARAVERLDPAR